MTPRQLVHSICLLVLFSPALLRAEALEYGKTPLQVLNPVGFVDSASISPILFERTRDNAGLDGVLLKVYLPDTVAQLYSDGRPDALARQVHLYGIHNAQDWTFDRKALDLMGKSLESAFSSYEVIPDDVRRNRPLLEQTLREAAQKDDPLLVQTIYGDSHISYLTLISYPLTSDFNLTQAMSTTLVLVGERIVFVNASSIIQSGAFTEHLAWARSAAESFVDMLASANKS